MTNSRYPENVQVLIAACELSVFLVHPDYNRDKRHRQKSDSGYIQPSFREGVRHCEGEYCDKHVSCFHKRSVLKVRPIFTDRTVFATFVAF